MLLSAAQTVNQASSAYAVGQWTGRVVLVALVVLLVRKYVFKRDSPVLRLSRQARHATHEEVPIMLTSQEDAVVAAPGMLARDILPHDKVRPRRRP